MERTKYIEKRVMNFLKHPGVRAFLTVRFGLDAEKLLEDILYVAKNLPGLTMKAWTGRGRLREADLFDIAYRLPTTRRTELTPEEILEKERTAPTIAQIYTGVHYGTLEKSLAELIKFALASYHHRKRGEIPAYVPPLAFLLKRLHEMRDDGLFHEFHDVLTSIDPWELTAKDEMELNKLLRKARNVTSEEGARKLLEEIKTFVRTLKEKKTSKRYPKWP